MDELYKKVYKFFNTKKIHIMLLQLMLIIVEDQLVQELCLNWSNNSLKGSIILMNILSKIINTLQKNSNIHCSLEYGSLSYKK
jgi:hypothetical protein